MLPLKVSMYVLKQFYLGVLQYGGITSSPNLLSQQSPLPISTSHACLHKILAHLDSAHILKTAPDTNCVIYYK